MESRKNGVDPLLEEEPEECRGDDAEQQDERQPALRVALERAFPDGRPGRRQQLQHVAPEVGQERRQGAHVQHDHELGAVDERVVPTQDAGQQDEMGRRGDGQELGEPLHHPDDDGLDDLCHAGSPGTGGTTASWDDPIGGLQPADRMVGADEGADLAGRDPGRG